MKSIAVYGAGGHGQEIAWIAQACGYQVVAFVDDDKNLWGQSLNGIPVLALDDACAHFPDVVFAAAFGYPRTRKVVVPKLAPRGCRFVSLVHPTAQISPTSHYGDGFIAFPNSVVTANARLGRHVQFNLGATVSHDCIIGDFCTLSPGVHVCGNVHLGRAVFVGAGATISNGTPSRPLVIGDDAVIGAGACVIGDIPPGVTAVGVPARGSRSGSTHSMYVAPHTHS